MKQKDCYKQTKINITQISILHEKDIMPSFNFSVSLKLVTASYVIFSLCFGSGNGNINDYITRRNN